jgi:hypothetical protein
MNFLRTVGSLKLQLLLAIVAIASPAFAQTQFDISGATEIYPTVINANGSVAGYYATASPSCCPTFGKDFFGFIRDAVGNVTTFATAAYYPNSSSTVVWGMNSSGVTVGEGYVVSLYTKGFIRAADGSFTLINPGSSGLTSARAINDSGQVTGTWLPQGPPYQSHGFVYSAGTITSFDVPNPSKTVLTTQTRPETIDALGNVAGTFVDSNGAYHVFLRTNKGHFTTYDIPGSQSIVVTRLNNSGLIGGRSWTGTSQVGFTLVTGGKKVLTTFSSPYASAYTSPQDLNNSGIAVGPYWDGTHNHGFRWYVTSGFTYFDMPSATDTVPMAINDSTVSTGYFFDLSGAAHGFIY